MRLRDLVLFNLVAVIGISWVATAAKAGPSSLTLWVLAAILFFVPQGLACYSTFFQLRSAAARDAEISTADFTDDADLNQDILEIRVIRVIRG